MISIRRFAAIGSAAAGLCAVVAFSLAPAAVLAEGSHKTHPKVAAAQTVREGAPTAATPSAACTAARQAIATAMADDRAEDTAE
jgi:hypothetical protein